ISTYSLGNGFLVWPIGLALLVAQRDRLRTCLCWCAIAATVVIPNFIDYVGPDPATRALALQRPLDFARYCLVFLGRPVVDDVTLTTIAGISQLLILVASSVYLFRQPLRSIASLSIWWGLAAFAFVSAGMTALARLDGGVSGALASRY